MTRARTSVALWITLAYGCFVVYGSLVPLRYRPVPVPDALDRFGAILSRPVVISSRIDVLVNILLFVPLAFLACGSLGRQQASAIRRMSVALAVIAACIVLSAGIEFAQLFFPSRTVALSDVLAQAAGAACGALAWLLAGRHVATWFAGLIRPGEHAGALERLLFGYCVVFFIAAVIPLDIVVSPGELAHKYRAGRIVIVPFGYTHGSWFAAAWDYVGDVVLFAPIGVAGGLVGTTAGTRRPPWAAVVIGIGFAATVELAQVFVNSRYADVTDVLSGTAGAVAGAAIPGRLVRRGAHATASERDRVLLMWLLLIAWICCLLAYHWYPLDFTLDPSRVAEGRRQIFALPLTWYYVGTEVQAFTQFLRKTTLGVPLGILLWLSAPPWVTGRRRWARMTALGGAGFVTLLGVEIGQVFLPARLPDVTDALVGTGGVVFGLWAASLVAPQAPRRRQDAGPGRCARVEASGGPP